MNINQARSLIKSVTKVTKKKCPHCGGKRVFSIVSERSQGWERHYVRMTCPCGASDYKAFNR